MADGAITTEDGGDNISDKLTGDEEICVDGENKDLTLAHSNGPKHT